jgi:monofunctional glycosyltransferase
LIRRTWKLTGYVLGAAVLAFLLVQLWFYGHILYWAKYEVGSTRFMDARLSEMRERNPKAQLRYRWVEYSRISPALKRAVVAAEDDKFIDHEGFDWEGIQRALKKNEKKGRAVAGGSTISQQLAKNLFLSGERSYIRKGEEALITLMLESTLSKRRILELYMNVAEWGEGVFGAEAAARHYYGISASQLNAWQAARLAAMLPRPRYYDQNRGSTYLAGYSNRILGRMHYAQIP